MAGAGAPARRRAGSASASAAPARTTTAPTPTAGTKPSTKACAEAWLPAPANTEASTATPKTPPTSRIALLAPDACPARSGATDPRIAAADGAKVSAIPTPAIANGTISWPKVTSAEATTGHCE